MIEYLLDKFVDRIKLLLYFYFRAQLDLLSVKFRIIALCETAINNCHTCYNIPGYALEQDFRPKRKGGGVALYIANTL